MTVARPSTPASYFHLLRRQAYARPRRPLVVFTPKAMLRLRDATSGVADFTQGAFQPVIDDDRSADKAAVKKVLMHSGKIHWDLRAELDKNPNPEIALVRLEQLYPAPKQELKAVLQQYPNAELVWVQDEPENQGAWPYIALALSRHLGTTGRRERRLPRCGGISCDRIVQGARRRARRAAQPRTGLIEQHRKNGGPGWRHPGPPFVVLRRPIYTCGLTAVTTTVSAPPGEHS